MRMPSDFPTIKEKTLTVYRILAVAIVVVAASMSAVGQQANACSNEGPYDFPTKLSGGYRIKFTADDELKYLHLWKRRKRIAELSSVSCGLLDKNLGYIGADFPGHFAFVNSFGSGNPNWVSLIRKADGKNVLSGENKPCWIDADVSNSLLVYSDACVPKAQNKIILFNLRSRKKRYLYFPKYVLSGPEALSRISIASISRAYVSLRFEAADGDGSIRRRYRY